MQFTDQQLDSFIELYRQQFGIVIDRTEASKQAADLIGLVKMLYVPMTKTDHHKYYGRVLNNR